MAYVRAMIAARLSGSELPGRDEAQTQADADVIDRWRKAHDCAVDTAGAKDRLLTRLARLAARHAEESRAPAGA